MDSIIEKVGIYDILVYLIPGIVFLLGLINLDIPIITFISIIDNELVCLCNYIVLGLVLGMIIHEVGYYLFTKIAILNFKKKSQLNYLKNINIYKDDVTKNKYKKIVCKVSKVETPKKEHCKNAFSECLKYCKTKSKTKKYNVLNILCTISRSLCVIFFGLLIIACIKFLSNLNLYLFLMMLVFFVLTFLFGYRTKRYAERMVIEILDIYYEDNF